MSVLLGTLLLTAGCANRRSTGPEGGVQTPGGRIERKLDIVEAARSTIGARYRFGGSSPATGFDCSGLVCWSYQQVGIQLPRSARDQIMFGTKVEKREDLKPGDIVVFKGTRGRTGWHSGIYTGNGKFVHSPSTGKNVTESRLDENYFSRRYAGARRIPRDGSARELYARYEEGRRAAALAANEARQAKQSRKRPALAKTGSKGKPAVAGAKAGGGLTVAGAGSGNKDRTGDAGITRKKSGKSVRKADAASGRATPRSGAVPGKAKTARPARNDNMQAAKNIKGSRQGRSKHKS